MFVVFNTPAQNALPLKFILGGSKAKAKSAKFGMNNKFGFWSFAIFCKKHCLFYIPLILFRHFIILKEFA